MRIPGKHSNMCRVSMCSDLPGVPRRRPNHNKKFHKGLTTSHLMLIRIRLRAITSSFDGNCWSFLLAGRRRNNLALAAWLVYVRAHLVSCASAKSQVRSRSEESCRTRDSRGPAGKHVAGTPDLRIAQRFMASCTSISKNSTASGFATNSLQ